MPTIPQVVSCQLFT